MQSGANWTCWKSEVIQSEIQKLQTRVTRVNKFGRNLWCRRSCRWRWSSSRRCRRRRTWSWGSRPTRTRTRQKSVTTSTSIRPFRWNEAPSDVNTTVDGRTNYGLRESLFPSWQPSANCKNNLFLFIIEISRSWRKGPGKKKVMQKDSDVAKYLIFWTQGCPPKCFF